MFYLRHIVEVVWIIASLAERLAKSTYSTALLKEIYSTHEVFGTGPEKSINLNYNVSSQPRNWTGSPALQADSLPTELWEKPVFCKNGFQTQAELHLKSVLLNSMLLFIFKLAKTIAEYMVIEYPHDYWVIKFYLINE